MDFFNGLITSWEYFGSSGRPFVLYGMGDGADKVLDELLRLGIKPYGVMASDDFVRGQSFRGYTVKKLSDFEEELSDFDIALCFASSLPEVTAHIRSIAEKHKVLVPSVPVFGNNIFNREFAEAHQSELDEAYSLLSDELSRRVFEGVAKFEFSGELSYLDEITTSKSAALGLLNLGENESYLDLGAYTGDTIEEFLGVTGGKYKSITALEPNIKSFGKLEAFCEGMENVTLFNYGSYNRNTTLKFNTKSGRNCAISENGVELKVARVDSLLCGKRITYAKLDVEGAEAETLEGMEKTIALFKPKLNVAAYHRGEDLFDLILRLNRLNPEYRFYLRHHPYIPHWDTNIYAV